MSAKIIVADDHSLIRLAIAQLIQLEPDMECVGQCETVEETRERLLDDEIDLVICDLQFNFGNILDLIDEMRTVVKSKFLVSSAHRPELFAPLCKLKGAHGFIHKTQSSEILLESAKLVLEGCHGFVKGYQEESDPTISPSLSSLSNREWQVLLEIGYGHSTKEIAKRLFLSEKTIESHRLSIKRKLSMSSKDQLASFASEVSTVLGEITI